MLPISPNPRGVLRRLPHKCLTFQLNRKGPRAQFVFGVTRKVRETDTVIRITVHRVVVIEVAPVQLVVVVGEAEIGPGVAGRPGASDGAGVVVPTDVASIEAIPHDPAPCPLQGCHGRCVEVERLPDVGELEHFTVTIDHEEVDLTSDRPASKRARRTSNRRWSSHRAQISEIRGHQQARSGRRGGRRVRGDDPQIPGRRTLREQFQRGGYEDQAGNNRQDARALAEPRPRLIREWFWLVLKSSHGLPWLTKLDVIRAAGVIAHSRTAASRPRKSCALNGDRHGVDEPREAVKILTRERSDGAQNRAIDKSQPGWRSRS